MKQILIHLADLKDVVEQASSDNMTYFKFYLVDEVIDEKVIFPSFLHVEAYSEDGTVKDYDAIDSVHFIKAS